MELKYVDKGNNLWESSWDGGGMVVNKQDFYPYNCDKNMIE